MKVLNGIHRLRKGWRMLLCLTNIRTAFCNSKPSAVCRFLWRHSVFKGTFFHLFCCRFNVTNSLFFSLFYWVLSKSSWNVLLRCLKTEMNEASSAFKETADTPTSDATFSRPLNGMPDFESSSNRLGSKEGMSLINSEFVEKRSVIPVFIWSITRLKTSIWNLCTTSSGISSCTFWPVMLFLFVTLHFWNSVCIFASMSSSSSFISLMKLCTLSLISLNWMSHNLRFAFSTIFQALR